MKSIFLKTIRWIWKIILTAFILSLFFVVLYKYIPIYYTPTKMVNSLKELFYKEKTKSLHQWRSLSDISPNLMNAVIASEDFLFLIHNGFDTDNSNRNLNKGPRILYMDNGTISQHTAKNVFLLPVNNDFNNFLKDYFTILIEFVWGKKRIMEVYLNSIEMAENVYGAESISEKYFQKPAKELSVQEAALIAACLADPENSDPLHPTTYLLRRQAKIISIMEDMININWIYDQIY